MLRIRARLLPALLLGLCLAAPARAETGRSILVLDASGSMWGQVEGEAKIAIAQRALFGLLETLPAEEELGLVAYGHRRKGDCGDIELLVPAGPGTRDAIRAAVAAISPKGKTPLSQAVIEAAEALRYEEAAATVILLSDGIETCDLDPCAVGAALEQAGVDFTAHVIGFDVAAEKDQAQLRCLAENTGGRFLTAANAAELAEALRQVGTEQPVPAEVPLLLRATDGEGGPVIGEPLLWSLARSDGTAVFAQESAATIERALPPGRYRAEVARPGDAAATGETFTLEAGGGQRVVTLVLDAVLPAASLQAPDQAPAGSTVTVGYAAPKASDDEIHVAEVGSPDGRWLRYEAVRERDAVEILLPTLPGPYELRYLDKRGRVLARRTIEATPIEASLAAPEFGPAGGRVEVAWSGPAYSGDYIAIVEVGADPDAFIHYVMLRGASPVELLLPTAPGPYEIRYQLGQDRRVLASLPFEVVGIDATLNAPATAPAGGLVEVAWTGPAYGGDYISISQPEAEDGAYLEYVDVREGSPVSLRLPAEPGRYEVRYVVGQDRTVLARAPLTLTAVAATLLATASAPAGSRLQVGWTGPAYGGDYISVTEVGAEAGSYLHYADVRPGEPSVELRLPGLPGTYEIRYIQNQGRKVLASQTIELTEVTATLRAAASGLAGAEIAVTWSGPAYPGDYISVTRPDSDGYSYIEYRDASDGSPVNLRLPAEPSRYEIRYVMQEGYRVLASTAVTVQ